MRLNDAYAVARHHAPVHRTPARTRGSSGWVRALVGRFSQAGNVILVLGDDAAVVAVPDGRVVISTDLTLWLRHQALPGRDWASASDIGHKAAAQNLSDINAMGGTATALTLALALPPDIPVPRVLEDGRGVREGQRRLVGASVVGEDITRSKVADDRRFGDRGCRRATRRRGRAQILVTSSRCAADRVGRLPGWPSSDGGSALRACWWRRTAGPSRRTPLGRRPASSARLR